MMIRLLTSCACLSAALPSAVAALTLTVSATSDRDISALMPGDVFSVTYQAESFPFFSGADIGVVYDPAVINATGIAFGDVFSASGALTSATVPPDTPGDIDDISFSTFLSQSGQAEGDVELFTLSFVAVGSGTSAITASEVAGGFVGDGILSDTEITIDEVSATVVPLPPAAALLLGGLAALGFVRRARA